VTGPDPDLTVVIAAKNEAHTIGEVVRRSAQFAGRIIVVDGHSSDGTAEVALESGAEVLPDHGRGKGDAIRTAIPAVTSAITVFMDADGSHNPADIPLLAVPIKEGRSDHVSASRLLGGSSELHGGFDEFLRLAGSSFITACINRRFRVRLSDSQNGFRAVRTDVLRRLDLRANITTIEQEMIMKTLRGGYRIHEVPSHEFARCNGQSRIVIRKVAHRYLLNLIKNLLP
jgi:dolichol-phosphate hexosyltransferase